MNNKARHSALIASLFTTAIAFAADLPSELRACTAESISTARLTCFDNVAAKVAAQTQGVPASASAVDSKAERPQVAKAPVVVTEETFGLRAGASTSKDGLAPVSKIASRVAKVETIGRGRLLVTLENGQVWEQLTADRLFSVNPGDVVTVKTGTFNSFLLVTAFNRFTTVSRIR